MIVETDWPVSCSGVTMSEKSVPISAAGQSQWVADIRDTISGLPGGHGLGIVYWEPGWIGNANLGSGCSVSQLCLSFDSEFFACVSDWFLHNRTISSSTVPETLVAAFLCSLIQCKLTETCCHTHRDPSHPLLQLT